MTGGHGWSEHSPVPTRHERRGGEHRAARARRGHHRASPRRRRCATDSPASWSRGWTTTPLGADDFSGLNTRRTGALLSRCPSSVDAGGPSAGARRGRSHAVAEEDDVPTAPHAVDRHRPGSPAQHLHRDHWCFDFFPFPRDVDVEVSSIWALDRLHRGERRDPRGARQPSHRGRRPLHAGGLAARRDAARVGGAVPRLAPCTAAARTAATRCASASTSTTCSAGCARRRTST